MGAFVLISKESSRRRVSLWEHEVSHDPKSGREIGVDEEVGVWPPVEAYAKAISLKHTVDLRKRGFKPFIVVVVKGGLAGPEIDTEQCRAGP
jgi:hypothetical protein